jgi:hypothetical protein
MLSLPFVYIVIQYVVCWLSTHVGLTQIHVYPFLPMEDPSNWKDSKLWMHALIHTGWEDQHSDSTVMFPSQDSRNISFSLILNVFWLWHFIKHFVVLSLMSCVRV